MDNHKDREEIAEALSGRSGMSLRYSKTLRQEMMYVSVPVGDSGEIKAVLRLSVPITSVKNSLKKIQNHIITAVLIIALIIMSRLTKIR